MIFRLKNLLVRYVYDNNPAGVAEEDGDWILEHGKIVVDTLIAGMAPQELRRNTKNVHPVSEGCR